MAAAQGGGDRGGAQVQKEKGAEEGPRQSRLADVAAERHVVRPAGLQNEHHDEDDRDGDRGAEPEVGALLGEELGELPAIHLRNACHSATASRSWSLDSPPVRPRKSASRLSVSGTSAVIAMRAWPSAIESAPTASSSALKRRSSPSSTTSSSPA